MLGGGTILYSKLYIPYVIKAISCNQHSVTVSPPKMSFDLYLDLFYF